MDTRNPASDVFFFLKLFERLKAEAALVSPNLGV